MQNYPISPCPLDQHPAVQIRVCTVCMHGRWVCTRSVAKICNYAIICISSLHIHSHTIFFGVLKLNTPSALFLCKKKKCHVRVLYSISIIRPSVPARTRLPHWIFYLRQAAATWSGSSTVASHSVHHLPACTSTSHVVPPPARREGSPVVRGRRRLPVAGFRFV